jgi:amino acid permease
MDFEGPTWHYKDMNKKYISLVLYVVAALFLIVAIIYFVEPANHLPSFFPGSSDTLTKKHVTHAVAALGLAVVAVVLAWFQGGKKSDVSAAEREQ